MLKFLGISLEEVALKEIVEGTLDILEKEVEGKDKDKFVRDGVKGRPAKLRVLDFGLPFAELKYVSVTNNYGCGMPTFELKLFWGKGTRPRKDVLSYRENWVKKMEAGYGKRFYFFATLFEE